MCLFNFSVFLSISLSVFLSLSLSLHVSACLPASLSFCLSVCLSLSLSLSLRPSLSLSVSLSLSLSLSRSLSLSTCGVVLADQGSRARYRAFQVKHHLSVTTTPPISKSGANVLLIFLCPVICPTPSQVDILVSDGSLAFSPTMYNRIFTWVETRAKSEFRMRLVP